MLPLFVLFIVIHFLFCCSTSLRKKISVDRWFALPQNLYQSLTCSVSPEEGLPLQAYSILLALPPG